MKRVEQQTMKLPEILIKKNVNYLQIRIITYRSININSAKMIKVRGERSIRKRSG